MAETVNYRAKSIANSTTVIVNSLIALAALLASDEVRAVLGPDALKYVTVAIAVINAALRVMTVRPVAMVRPGRTKPVQVRKLA